MVGKIYFFYVYATRFHAMSSTWPANELLFTFSGSSEQDLHLCPSSMEPNSNLGTISGSQYFGHLDEQQDIGYMLWVMIQPASNNNKCSWGISEAERSTLFSYTQELESHGIVGDSTIATLFFWWELLHLTIKNMKRWCLGLDRKRWYLNTTKNLSVLRSYNKYTSISSSWLF